MGRKFIKGMSSNKEPLANHNCLTPLILSQRPTVAQTIKLFIHLTISPAPNKSNKIKVIKKSPKSAKAQIAIKKNPSTKPIFPSAI